MEKESTLSAHLALNGQVYRYDDPFWHTFYPPNGFNCRCTVIALDERALKRKGLEVGSSEGLLVQAKRLKDKAGNQATTTGFALPDGRILATDKGFDYNVGRLTYKPNLDLYAEPLAHQFAKAEMSGAEFRLGYRLLVEQVAEIKSNNGKLNATEMIAIRDRLNRNFKFAAGRLTDLDKALMGVKTSTIWLSDDTLIKQLNSREGQNFTQEVYEKLPDVFFSSDVLLRSDEFNDRFIFIKDGLLAVIKHIKQENELFLLSFRKVKEKEVLRLKERENVLR